MWYGSVYSSWEKTIDPSGAGLLASLPLRLPNRRLRPAVSTRSAAGEERQSARA